MKVKCLNNVGVEDSLTVGQTYDAVETSVSAKIYVNVLSGREDCAPMYGIFEKSRFEIVG